jgi:hypothetical protein
MLNTLSLRFHIWCSSQRDRLAEQSGQGALEYIAIVLGLVVLVAAGFYIAGGKISDKAGQFVQDILDQTPTP